MIEPLIRTFCQLRISEERSEEVKKSIEVTKALLKEYDKRMTRLKEPLNERMQTTELFIQSVSGEDL